MNYSEIATEFRSLPKALSNSETIEYLKKVRLGDKEAKKKIIIHNLRLIISRIKKKFNSVPCDINELVSVGVIGLDRAINGFDIDKGFRFSTYATIWIDGEIIAFLKEEKKNISQTSLCQVLKTNNDSKEYLLYNILYDDKINVERDYEIKEMNLILKQIINELTEEEKDILKLYYGLYNTECHTQTKIAKMYKTYKMDISLRIKKILRKLKLKLENEYEKTNTQQSKINSQKNDEKLASDVHTRKFNKN